VKSLRSQAQDVARCIFEFHFRAAILACLQARASITGRLINAYQNVASGAFDLHRALHYTQATMRARLGHAETTRNAAASTVHTASIFSTL